MARSTTGRGGGTRCTALEVRVQRLWWGLGPQLRVHIPFLPAAINPTHNALSHAGGKCSDGALGKDWLPCDPGTKNILKLSATSSKNTIAYLSSWCRGRSDCKGFSWNPDSHSYAWKDCSSDANIYQGVEGQGWVHYVKI